MNIETFRKKAIVNKIPESWYSINNGVKFNACILVDNKSYWESFYFDEKGETHNLHLFSNEEEVLDYLWKQIERMMLLYKWNKQFIKPTWGYKLYDLETGEFLKNGITNKPIPQARYTKPFMSDKFMVPVKQFPIRLEAYQWEYQQNLIQRGPLNLNMH